MWSGLCLPHCPYLPQLLPILDIFCFLEYVSVSLACLYLADSTLPSGHLRCHCLCPPTLPRLACIPFLWTLPSHKWVHAKSLQSCLTLYDPVDCSLPGSCIHGIPRQEYWSGLPCPPPGDLPEPGIEPAQLSCILSWCCSLRSPGSRFRIVVRSREDRECLLWKEKGCVLVSCGRQDKLPQMWRPETTGMFSFTVLEARSPKSRSQLGCTFSDRLQGRICSVTLPASGDSWHPWLVAA